MVACVVLLEPAFGAPSMRRLCGNGLPPCRILRWMIVSKWIGIAALLRWFWQPLSRDITLVHSQLHESGCATWMEEARVMPRVPAQTDLQRAVAAVRKLFGED